MTVEKSASSSAEKEYTFYYPSGCRHADRNLHAATSSYTEISHASGLARIAPGHPDYELWLWIVARLTKEH